MINTYCNDVAYDFDWNNNLKSSMTETNYTTQKANTSLALGNNNISRCSPYQKGDDSHLGQINEDPNNMSIFQKECDNK